MAININPFLQFNGNCRVAFEFYKNAFGGDFTMISTAEENALPIAENEKNLLVYIELPIGGIKLMGADMFPSMGDKLQLGNQNYVVINTTTQEEANKLFVALSGGGTIETPIGEQYFGYYGSFTDKFGIGWMFLC